MNSARRESVPRMTAQALSIRSIVCSRRSADSITGSDSNSGSGASSSGTDSRESIFEWRRISQKTNRSIRRSRYRLKAAGVGSGNRAGS